MARDESPPFDRGMYESTTGAMDHLIGKEYRFEDLDYSSRNTTKPVRTNRYVTVRLVKNSSGGALLPKRLVRFKASGTKYGQEVDGYTATTAERGYPVDEFIASAGVPDGAYFYIVVGGPAVVLTSLSALSADVAIGDIMVAITAATSGATTAGRVLNQDLTGATALLGAQIQQRVGRALSAKTTGNTNADLLLDLGRW